MNISIDGSAEIVNLVVWAAVLGLAGYLIWMVLKSVLWVVVVVLIIGLLVPGAISWNKLADSPLGGLASGKAAAAGQNPASAGSGLGAGSQAAADLGSSAGSGTGNAGGAQPAPDGMAVLLNTIMATMTVVTDWIVAWGLDAFNRYMTPQVEFPDGGGGAGGGGSSGAGGGSDGKPTETPKPEARSGNSGDG